MTFVLGVSLGYLLFWGLSTKRNFDDGLDEVISVGLSSKEPEAYHKVSKAGDSKVGQDPFPDTKEAEQDASGNRR